MAVNEELLVIITFWKIYNVFFYSCNHIRDYLANLVTLQNIYCLVHLTSILGAQDINMGVGLDSTF